MSAAAEVARALGGAPSGSGWHRCRCPAHNGKSQSLAIKDGATGLVVKCHAGCQHTDVVNELARLELLPNGTVLASPDPVLLQQQKQREEAERQRRLTHACKIWEKTERADEIYVKPYLWGRLCIADEYTPIIRFHPSLDHAETRSKRPAMVCLIQHVETGSVGVHATYLQLDHQHIARKAPIDPPRKTFGPYLGGSVHLDEIGEEGALVVGEGIETVLSVMLSLGRPGWAALNAINLTKLILPPKAKHIYIAADNDVNEVGQKAALKAAHRFESEGREVTVAWPPEPDTDFNDVLMQEGPSWLGDIHV